MVNKWSLLSLVFVLTLPISATANAPHSNNGAVARVPPPPAQTPPHHKVRCCSGRMQAQPRPQH
jgi:hypothetical protein